MKIPYKILLSLFTGVLVCISFPTLIGSWHLPELGFLGFVALVPLFVALHKAGARESFLLTVLAASVWYGGSLYWVYNAMHDYGGLSSTTSILVTILLVLVVSIYIALAPFLSKILVKNFRCEPLVVLPVAWAAFEFFRNYFPCAGFPWSNIAMSQYKLLPVIQIVDFVGVYGLIFLLVFINQFLAEAVVKLRGEAVGYFIQKLLIALVLMIAVLGYGYYRMHTLAATFAYNETLKVGLIQGNIDQGDKWKESKTVDNLNIYRVAAKNLAKSAVDLIIWPEAAYPWFIDVESDSILPSHLGINSSETTDWPYSLIGAIGTSSKEDFYNSAFLFDRSGRKEGTYHKMHLVPFGEYVPYKKILFFVDKLTREVGNLKAGDSYNPLYLEDIGLGVLICYETIFPEIARKQVLAGASFIANLTNDAWYGVSSAPFQHLALSVFRAVENRRYLVEATNTGVSAIIDPMGHIVTQSRLFEDAVIVSVIKPLWYLSAYSRLGDWFAFGCVGYLVIVTICGLLNWRYRCPKS